MGEWPGYYILLDRLPVAVDVMTWAKWFESHDRQIANDHVGRIRISTVFLGLDHSFMGHSDPVLFETMAFGGPLDGVQWRYCTYSEAEQGHQEMLAKAKIAAAQIKSIHDKAHT